MRNILIIILILLVLGLYFIPDTTKDLMKVTGSAVKEVGGKAIDTVKETEIYQNVTGSIKENEVFEVVKDK